MQQMTRPFRQVSYLDYIASVRVDKRGMFSSAKAGDPNAVTVDIYAQDYRDWAEAIRSKTGQSCVYMLGHSEGTLMVSAASVGTDNICGLILTAGMGRAFGASLWRCFTRAIKSRSCKCHYHG